MAVAARRDVGASHSTSGRTTMKGLTRRWRRLKKPMAIGTGHRASSQRQRLTRLRSTL
jgi:hypothetical protein